MVTFILRKYEYTVQPSLTFNRQKILVTEEAFYYLQLPFYTAHERLYQIVTK